MLLDAKPAAASRGPGAGEKAVTPYQIFAMNERRKGTAESDIPVAWKAFQQRRDEALKQMRQAGRSVRKASTKVRRLP